MVRLWNRHPPVTWRVSVAAIGAAVVLLSSGCASAKSTSPSSTVSSAPASSAPAVAPVTVDVGDLQGARVVVGLDQVVDIDTGDLAVDSYTAQISDPTVAEFIQGRTEATATYNPGLQPLGVGETQVTLTNEQGGIQPLAFTLIVTR
jgi:hypothetical protein